MLYKDTCRMHCDQRDLVTVMRETRKRMEIDYFVPVWIETCTLLTKGGFYVFNAESIARITIIILGGTTQHIILSEWRNKTVKIRPGNTKTFWRFDNKRQKIESKMKLKQYEIL